MKVKFYNRLGLAFLTIGLVVGGAGAQQYGFTGARASGMAGANAASTRDSSAIWINPAALAYLGQEKWATNAVNNGNIAQEDFHLEVFGMGLGYTMTDDMGRYLDILTDIDFKAFESGSLSSDAENVRSLVSMAGALGSVNQNDALYADFNAGLSLQIGRFGTGLRVFGEAGAWTVPDINHIALGGYGSVTDFVDELKVALGADLGFNADTHSFGILTDQQRDELSAALDNVGRDSDTLKYIDAKLADVIGSGDIKKNEIAAAVDLISKFGSGDPAALIDNNQTVVVGRGFTVAEVPLSYGYAFNKNFSVGITAKAMYGSVLGANVWVFDEDSNEVLEDISNNYNSSFNFGLDLGMLYRIPNFQIALVGRNLTGPTFDGFTDTVMIGGAARQYEIKDVKIDPQVTFGAAWIPSERFMLESNFELLETGTLVKSYNIQRFSVGGEVDLTLLALRLGGYRNIAEDWQDWVATAGVGLNIFGFRVDVGGAYGFGDAVEYDGAKIPSEARLFASVGFDY